MTRVSIASADPNDSEAQTLIAELGAELTRVTGHFTAWSYSPAEALLPRSVFVVARDGTHGVGHAILTHLEQAAVRFGYTQIWLETGVENARAIRFYERHGYSAIPNFGPYVGRAEATCLGKRLDPL